MTNQNGQIENQEITEEAVAGSVRVTPKGAFNQPLANGFTVNLATVADNFTAWGGSLPGQTRTRDWELRRFWPTEPILASAIYNMVTRNTTFAWTLTGPEAIVEPTQQILHMSDIGRGWRSFISKMSTDLFTQDNGAFGEIIREEDRPDSPVVNVAHLDASRCVRTGDPFTPVLYGDIKGRVHEMKWYQVFTWEELPSPIETMHGVQLCAVSRVLRAAQILRSIGIYQKEKISGSNPGMIYLTNGMGQAEIEDAIVQHNANQSNRGMLEYIVPLIVAGVDPSVAPSVESIDLKSLPDGFDIDQVMRWYINQLALGFGADYQDFAPLSQGNLGTSTQSEVLHEKSRGKGAGAFMQMVEYTFNFQGVIPQMVSFAYDEQDDSADKAAADLFDKESDAIKKNIESGALTPRAGTQLLLDKGFISEEVFELVLAEMEEVAAATADNTAFDRRMAEAAVGDVTTDVVAQDDEDITNKGQKQAVDNTGGAMIAFVPSESIRESLSMRNGQPVDQLHVTLAFLGDNAEMSEDDRRAIRAVTLATARRQRPITARFSGTARFQTDGELDPFVALLDSQELKDFREELVANLEAAEVEVSRKFSFTPHITLTMLAENQRTPNVELPSDDIILNDFVVVFGGESQSIDMSKEKKKRKKKRKGGRYGSKDFSSFESLPAFGEETRIDAEEEYLRRIMDVFGETLEDFERRIGTKGFKAHMVGKKEAPEDVFLDGEFWGDFRQRAFDVGEPFARKTALDAASLNVNVGLNVNMDFVNDEVLNFSRGYTNTFVDQLERTSKKQLQNAITHWQETGLGNRGLPDLVNALKPTFGTARAELIATNEVTKLFDEGNNLAHKAAGILIEEWATSEDGFVEEICVALNGKRFGVDEGPRPVTGTHIGCRCERLPVGNNGTVIG